MNVVERTAELNPSTSKPVSQLSSFGEDARGELFVCDLDGGETYQLVSAQSSTLKLTDAGPIKVTDSLGATQRIYRVRVP